MTRTRKLHQSANDWSVDSALTAAGLTVQQSSQLQLRFNNILSSNCVFIASVCAAKQQE